MRIRFVSGHHGAKMTVQHRRAVPRTAIRGDTLIFRVYQEQMALVAARE